MFGIDDMLLLPALGALGGGLLAKKDPVQGALMGGALGAAGGGLLGAGAVPSAATTASGAAMDAGISSAGIMANNAAITGAAAPVGGMAGMMTQAKPYMDAASTGVQVANQFKPDEMPPLPPIAPPTPMPNNTLGQLVTGAEQAKNGALQQAAQGRAMRRSQWG